MGQMSIAATLKAF